jgi:hypothetical protein
MWWLHWCNHVWHKVVGESLEWLALNIVKHHNVFYCHIITTQGLPRCFLKQRLQLEVHCLKLFFLDDTKIWDFGFKVALKFHVFLVLFTNVVIFHVYGHSNPPLNLVFGLQLNKLGNFGWHDVQWVFTYSYNPNIWSATKMISSFLIPWMCVVTLSMALKPYPKLCSCRRVVIQL